MAISPIGWRCLWLGMVPAALLFCHAALAADAAETAATACLGGVSALYPQHRFTEAADKYVCAADALAKDPTHADRAARYRANAWLLQAINLGPMPK